MDSSGRHKFCHSLISSSTVNQSFVFTTAFSTSPFFSLALGLRRGRCRSAPSPSLLFLFLFLLSRSVTSVGLLRLLLVAFLGRLDIFCQNLDLVGDGGLEARCLCPPLKPSSNLGVWKKNLPSIHVCRCFPCCPSSNTSSLLMLFRFFKNEFRFHLVQVSHLRTRCLALFSNFWRKTRLCHFFPMFLHLLTTSPSSIKLKSLPLSLDLTFVSCIFSSQPFFGRGQIQSFFSGIKKNFGAFFSSLFHRYFDRTISCHSLLFLSEASQKTSSSSFFFFSSSIVSKASKKNYSSSMSWNFAVVAWLP